MKKPGKSSMRDYTQIDHYMKTVLFPAKEKSRREAAKLPFAEKMRRVRHMQDRICLIKHAKKV